MKTVPDTVFDVVILGAGPAGCATALFLARSEPTLARRTLVLEKRFHPRHKVCAGGLIPHSLDCLRELGIELRVPHARVHHAIVRVPGREVLYSERDLCAVVRRSEFDALLAGEVRRRGIEIRENEKAVAVRREGDSIRVVTETNEYRAKVVVGADGSGSLVRRSLFAPDRNAVGRAVMCDIPATEAGWSGLEENRYVFDFRAVPDGLKGYVWEFPCWIDGTAHVNLGAYALDRGDGGVNLGELVRDRARMLGQSSPRLEAFPIRWYDPRSPIGGLRALLVGDAAGCDPLMGEGISYAFEYARLAASEIRSAFSRGCFELGGYSAAVAHSWVGRKLRRLRFASRFFYGPTSRLGFAMAARSRRLQDVGIRWYNGVDGWDRQSGWKVASRLVMGAS